MNAASREIKQALKKEFPTVKFSVTRTNSGYAVKWSDGLAEGATLSAVKEIAKTWDTSKAEGDRQNDTYVQYGDRVTYCHDLSEEWQKFVLDCYLELHDYVYYCEDWQCLRNKDGTRAFPYKLKKWLHDGIKTDVDAIKLKPVKGASESASETTSDLAFEKKLKPVPKTLEELILLFSKNWKNWPVVGTNDKLYGGYHYRGLTVKQGSWIASLAQREGIPLTGGNSKTTTNTAYGFASHFAWEVTLRPNKTGYLYIRANDEPGVGAAHNINSCNKNQADKAMLNETPQSAEKPTATFATETLKQEDWWLDSLKEDALKLEQKIYEQKMKQKKIRTAEEDGVAAITQFRKAIGTIEELENSILKKSFLREMAIELISSIAPHELKHFLKQMERMAEQAIKERASEEAPDPEENRSKAPELEPPEFEALEPEKSEVKIEVEPLKPKFQEVKVQMSPSNSENNLGYIAFALLKRECDGAAPGLYCVKKVLRKHREQNPITLYELRHPIIGRDLGVRVASLDLEKVEPPEIWRNHYWETIWSQMDLPKPDGKRESMPRSPGIPCSYDGGKPGLIVDKEVRNGILYVKLESPDCMQQFKIAGQRLDWPKPAELQSEEILANGKLGSTNETEQTEAQVRSQRYISMA